MKVVEAPPIDPAVVEWLESIFPNTLPREGTPYNEIERQWGQQKVVNRMRAELAKQIEN